MPDGSSTIGLPSDRLVTRLREKAGEHLVGCEVELGDAVARARRDHMVSLFSLLKADPDLRFNMLSSVTAVDWLDARPERFELIYQVYSVDNRARLRVKIDVPERDAEVDSLTNLWSSANFLEREVWDMYGIRFRNHPNLRRILMYEEFVGHPLRKDYPLRGKQPRVPLRHPEVRNTARDMTRPDLVQINRHQK